MRASSLALSVERLLTVGNEQCKPEASEESRGQKSLAKATLAKCRPVRLPKHRSLKEESGQDKMLLQMKAIRGAFRGPKP